MSIRATQAEVRKLEWMVSAATRSEQISQAQAVKLVQDLLSLKDDVEQQNQFVASARKHTGGRYGTAGYFARQRADSDAAALRQFELRISALKHRVYNRLVQMPPGGNVALLQMLAKQVAQEQEVEFHNQTREIIQMEARFFRGLQKQMEKGLFDPS